MDRDLREQIIRAEHFVESEIGPDRAKATRYYHSKPFGNEEEGRSKVVSTDVHDTVIGILPDLVEVLVSPENIVEFVPRGKEDVEQARQMTDYVAQVVMGIDNKGFRIYYDALQDAAVRKTGILKAYWEQRTVRRKAKMTGLTAINLEELAADDSVESYEVTGTEQQNVLGIPVEVYSCDVVRVENDGRIRVEAIPPEEFLISPNARSLETAQLVAHQRAMSIAEVVAQFGYDEDDVRAAGGDEGNRLDLSEEADARVPNSWGSPTIEDALEPDRRIVTESYPKQPDGGYKRVVSIGSKVFEEDECDRRPFCMLCFRPEAHSAIGYSLADETGFIQMIKSMVERAMLDSFTQSIIPRLIVSEDRLVDYDDVLATELGAPIRVRGGDTNVVRALVTPPLAESALPVLDYFDRKREETTGVSRASNGLNPDALQSSTLKAVSATVDARLKQTKMIASIIAYDLIDFYRLIVELTIKHQDRPRMVRLRGKWVEMDPKYWDAAMDVQVNIGVGPGTLEERKAVVDAVIQDHRNILENYGLETPLVNLPLHRKLLAKRLAMSGFKNDDEFYPPIPDDWQPPPPQPQSAQDPAMAAIEAEKQTREMETKRKAIEDLMRDDRERDKNEADAWLKLKDIELKYGQKIDAGELMALIERQRAFRAPQQQVQ